MGNANSKLLPEEAVKTILELLKVTGDDSLHVGDRRTSLQHALALKGDPDAGAAADVSDSDLAEVARLVSPHWDREDMVRWIQMAGGNPDGMTLAAARKRIADEQKVRECLAVIVDTNISMAERLEAIKTMQDYLPESSRFRQDSPEDLLDTVRPATDTRLYPVQDRTTKANYERRPVNRPPTEIYDVWKTGARG